jgi:hypothetical protein
MTYEEKMKALAGIQPEDRDKLLLRIIKGERVNIANNEDLFFQVNKDRMPLDRFVNRNKFKDAAKATKVIKDGLYDPRHGRSRTKKLRLMGEIPAEIWFSRPEFSPFLPKEERDKNIKKFLNDYPAFKVADGKV